MQDVKEHLALMGYETVGGSSQEFTAYLTSEYERWGDFVKKAGMKPE